MHLCTLRQNLSTMFVVVEFLTFQYICAMNFITRFVCFLLFVVPLCPALGTPIDTACTVDIGGIKQWINIKGRNDSNPVLLFLHGGPGNSVMGYADKFTNELQKHFVVVVWDQRESGKTAKLNASGAPLTVARMEEDAVEMINYLRSRYVRDKIYVMGHSWGGFLGLKVAADHPELLKALFAVSPMINQLESERMSLQWMKDKAKSTHNDAALRDLNTVSIPFQNGEQLYYHRSWLLKLAGRKSPSKATVVTWAETWLNLFNEASALSFFKIAPKIECPVYFFVGKKDYQTHFKITKEYYAFLKAEKKGLFWFDYAAHNLPTSEPAKLQEIIIREILLKP